LLMGRCGTTDGVPAGLLLLWVTTDCNLRCRYCYARGGERKEYMSWPVAKRAIDLMAACPGTFKVQFAGGEPLLNMELVERVIRYMNDGHIGAGYQLQTNATLVTETVAQNLKELHIAVGVSLDGPPAVNDRLRPFPDSRGSTGAVVAGIKNLGKAGIRTGLTCVLSAENIAGLPGLVDMASYLGNIEGISIDVLRQAGRARQAMRATPEMATRYLDAAIRRADQIAAMGGPTVKFREVERMRHMLATGQARQYRCYFDACQSVMVTPDGNTYPCASLSGPEFLLGNVREEGFEDSLHKRLARAKTMIVLPARCLSCSDRELCGGPCPAGTYGTAGNTDVECAVRRVFVRHAALSQERH
jgi:uncharacterized protein